MKTAFDLEFPPNVSVIRTARDSVEVLASELPQAKLDDVRLLISELVTNSVRHGGLGAEGYVRVKLSLDDGHVRAEVHDSGRGFEVQDPPPPMAESGWGIYLVESIADRWGVERDDETCVWFEVDL